MELEIHTIIILWVIGVIILYYTLKYEEGWNKYRSWNTIIAAIILCIFLWYFVLMISIVCITIKFIKKIRPEDPPRWL